MCLGAGSVEVLEERQCLCCHAFGALLEVRHYSLEAYLGLLLVVLLVELLLAQRHLGSHQAEHLHLGILIEEVLYDVVATVPDSVYNVHAYALSHECVATLGVYHGTLLVHHIIILKQAFADAEVVFLDLLLGTLY